MAFDLSTAKPVAGFDISTARPVGEDQEAQQLSEDIPIGADLAPQGELPGQQTTPYSAIRGGLDVAGTTLGGMGEKALEGLSELGGLAMGKTGQESIKAAQAMTGAIPDAQMGAAGERLISDISERFQTAPETVKNILGFAAESMSELGPRLGESVMSGGEALGLPPEVTATGATVARMLPEALEAGMTLGSAQAARQAGGQVVKKAVDMSGDIKRPMVEFAADAGLIGGDASASLGSGIADTASVAIGKLQDLSKTQRDIKKQVRAGDLDRYTSKYDVTDKNVLVKNPVVAKAEGLGVDTGLISMLRRAKNTPNTSTAKKMRNMLNIKRQGRKYIEQESKHQPSVIVGESLLDRLDKVKEVNRQAGKAIRPVVNKLKGQEVYFGPAVTRFNDSLSDLGASYNPDTKSLDFTEKSLIGRNPAGRKVLNEIVDYMSVGGTPDAYDLHELKVLLDDQIAYGKSAQTGLSGKSERVIRELRSDIDAALDGKFPEYDEVNSIYSETIDILNEIQDLAGTRMDLSGKRSRNTAGKLMRGIQQNNKSTEALVNAVENLEDLAVKHGGQYDDNLDMLSRFAIELDRQFGTSAPASFQGGIESGIGVAAERMMPSRGGAIKEGIKAGGRKARQVKEGLFGDAVRDERLKFEVLEELLKETK